MEDSLTCLSMHQPWASLLVYGIKRVEGRTWDSQYRGRLWIHATAQDPEPEEIAQLQEFYTQVHGLDGRVPVFPPAYPRGVLLGCVEWPGLPGSCRLEASSPFCFLCEKPKRLVVPQPLRGQHKLWQLPRSVLKVALQGLRDPPPLGPLTQPPPSAASSSSSSSPFAFSWRAFGDPRAMLSPSALAATPPPPSTASAAASAARAVRGAAGASASHGTQGAAGANCAKRGVAPAAAGAGRGRDSASVLPDGGDGDAGGSCGGGGCGGAGEAEGADVERRLRAVRKKLRQVSELETARRSGSALTAEQAAKLARAEQWRREAAELEAAAAAAGGSGGAAAGCGGGS